MKQVDTRMGISVWQGEDEELAGRRNKSLKDRISEGQFKDLKYTGQKLIGSLKPGKKMTGSE